jgi:SAM-dependent methyltransferase
MKSADFARLFDAQYRQFDDDLPFWLGLAERFGDPILELGCGAGRVLLSLAGAGYQLEGIEHNQAMLDRLAARLPAALQHRVAVRHADLRTTSLDRTYQLAIAPCNTLAEFDDEAMVDLLGRLRPHVAPQGALAFEAPPPAGADPGTREDQVLDTFHELDHDVDVQVSADQTFDADATRLDVVWHYDEMHDTGETTRFDHRSRYHLRRIDRYRTLLSQAGFGPLQCFGAYDGSPFGPDSHLLLVVAGPAPS